MAYDPEGRIPVYLNNSEICFDIDPIIIDGRTLVPLRFVAETLGAEVLWEEGWDGCKIKKGDKEIEITFGSAKFKVNGEEIIYDAPIELVYDRTMVPIRFISEQFDMDVYWNEKNSAVVISPKLSSSDTRPPSKPVICSNSSRLV